MNKTETNNKESSDIGSEFSRLTKVDSSRLLQQWNYVNQLIARYYNNEKLDKSLKDLDLIQRIVEDQILSPDQIWELQALGVVFGYVIVENDPDFDWWIINDEYGRDPTIRYKETSRRINALTVISKRVEKGREVDVHGLYKTLLDIVEVLNTYKEPKQEDL